MRTGSSWIWARTSNHAGFSPDLAFHAIPDALDDAGAHLKQAVERLPLGVFLHGNEL